MKLKTHTKIKPNPQTQNQSTLISPRLLRFLDREGFSDVIQATTKLILSLNPNAPQLGCFLSSPALSMCMLCGFVATFYIFFLDELIILLLFNIIGGYGLEFNELKWSDNISDYLLLMCSLLIDLWNDKLYCFACFCGLCEFR